MYIADFLNARGLFQRIGGWMQMPDVQTRADAFAVILQRASQVIFHLDQCASLRAQAVAQFAAHLKKEPGLPSSLHAWSPHVSGLIVEISGALSALRVMQNDVWALTAAVAGARDTPSSIRDAYNTFVRKYGHGSKRPRWLSMFDAAPRRLIVNYWESSGVHLANYRDVDQHHDVLARGAMLLTGNADLPKLSIQLPDNPEVKSRARFTYTRGVNAFELAENCFNKLHGLLEDIAAHNGAKPQSIRQGFEFIPPIIHKPGVAALTAVLLFDMEGRSGIVLGQNEKTQVTIRNIAL